MTNITINNDQELRDLFTINQPLVGDTLSINFIPIIIINNANVVVSIDGLINVELINNQKKEQYSFQSYKHKLVIFKSADHLLTDVYTLTR